MKRIVSLNIIIFTVFMMLFSTIIVCYGSNNQLAFPGAEGGGKYSPGARGGTNISVYHVTNLNDSGSGSLRDAVSKSGRIIVFDVSGTINLNKKLIVLGDNLTILGQTAPGDGITITGGDFIFEGRKNLIIRYLRVRPTDKNGGEPDGMGGRWTNNVIIDHCSTSWSVDETLTLYGGTSELAPPGSHNTVQYTISSESLRMSSHFKGAHGYGGIFGADMSSWHHNLLAHHDSRSPRLDREIKKTDICNNVIYNWGQTNSVYGAEPYSYNNKTKTPSEVNIVNNYYKYGPGTSKNLRSRIFDVSNAYPNESKSLFYINGNYVYESDLITNNNWKGVNNPNLADKSDSFINMADNSGDYNLSQLQTAADTYNTVLTNVGATLPKRDAIDARIISDVKNQTGRIINNCIEVGGLTATSNSQTRPFEIPNNWKQDNEMGNAEETDIVKNGKWAGYTWIEAYVNEWTEEQSAPSNPNITVLSPSIQSSTKEVNGHNIENGAWAVISENEPLNYKAIAEPVGDTVISKVDIYDGAKIIETVNNGNVNTNLILKAGTHYLSARAYNNNGEATQSPTSIVYVKSNQPAGEFIHTQIGNSGDFNNLGGSWFDNGIYTIMGSGKLTKNDKGIEGVNSDSCDFMYKKITGNFDITVKTEQIPKFENGSVAGIMLREDLTPKSRMIMLSDGWLKYGENVKSIIRDKSDSVSVISWFNGISNNSDYDTSKDEYHVPKYLRMRRNGDEITLSVSDSGKNWTDNPRKPMTKTIDNLADTVYVGLAVDSIMGIPCKEYMAEAKFSSLKLSINDEKPFPDPPEPLPKPNSYNITVSNEIQNGSVEIIGTASQTITWEASEHKDEINGAGVYNINGKNAIDGTITSYSDDTALFTYNENICVKGNKNPNSNPKVAPPFSEENQPNGAVFKIVTPYNGTIRAEIYLYTNKLFNLYNNNEELYIEKERLFGNEDIYTIEFDGTAGTEYYMWAKGSKIGLKSVTVETDKKSAAKKGDTVNIFTFPNNGYKVKSILINPECNISKISENKYTFIMPEKSVNITVEFIKNILQDEKKIYYEIRPSRNGNVINYSAVNNTDGKAIFAVAVYSSENGKLKDVELIEFGPHKTLNTPISLNIKENDTVKAFLWYENYSPAEYMVEL